MNYLFRNLQIEAFCGQWAADKLKLVRDSP